MPAELPCPGGRAAHAALLFAAVAGMAGCDPEVDQVFLPLGLLVDSELTVAEGVGIVDVTVRLSEPAATRALASFRLRGVEAQNHCPEPDFDAAEGQIEWPAGVAEASVRFWVGDDALAETDERFELVIEPLDGMPAAEPVRRSIVIADNDRTALVPASSYGVTPGRTGDQAEALQAALDDAANLGRGVVLLEPGDYSISTVLVPSGTTLSGRGARFLRPPASAEDVITVRVEQLGAANALPVLVEGLALDGRREQQGPYRDKEREHAHLLRVGGDPERGGRANASLEGLELVSGTGSGVMVGSDAEATLCDLYASELWRDAITVLGGAANVRIRGVDVTSTEGTGLWIGAREPGFEGSLALIAELEDVSAGAGDVELETTPGSSLTLRRLTMTAPPLRLDAGSGSVRISDSVLMLSLPGDDHAYVGPAHDLEISGTTLVASESEAGIVVDERARTFSTVTLRASGIALAEPEPGPGRLLFDRCRFELARDVEPDDVVYAVDNPIPGLDVTLRAPSLGPGMADYFAPDCSACAIEP